MGEGNEEKLNLIKAKYEELTDLNEKLSALRSQNDMVNSDNEQISFLGMAHININKKLYTGLISLGNIGLIIGIIFLLKKNNNV